MPSGRPPVGRGAGRRRPKVPDEEISADVASDTCRFCGRPQVRVAGFRATATCAPLCGCGFDKFWLRATAARRGVRPVNGFVFATHRRRDWHMVSDAGLTFPVTVEHVRGLAAVDAARQFALPSRLGAAFRVLLLFRNAFSRFMFLSW